MRSSALSPRCEGLLLHAGDHLESHPAALRLARRVVKRNLPGAWRVRAIHEGARDFEILRAGKKRSIPISTAWNHVHRLAADRDVRDAEPLLEMAGLEPQPRHMAKLLAPSEAPPSKSTLARAPQACSARCDWSVEQARITSAWEVELPAHGTGKRHGEGIRVGQPDTGYTRHPEIWDPGRLRVDLGYNFVEGKRDPRDPLGGGLNEGHGTATASVVMSGIGPATGQPVWITGAAPKAELVPLRVVETVVVFNFANVARAIYRAVDVGCHVITMSLGGPIASGGIRNAVEYAVSRGVIVLAAAGNYWPWVVFPARLDEVIAVAAIDCGGKPWKHSARGGDVDVSAPGESVWVARTPKDDPTATTCERGTGTSFAVTTVAGACALWLAYHGRDRLVATYGGSHLASVFREVLVSRGVRRPRGWDAKRYGAGYLDAERLLRAPLPPGPKARGMMKRRAPRTTPLDQVLALFPDLAPSRVRRSVAAAFQVTDRTLDAFLEELGAEVVFQLATNAGLRELVRRGGGGAGPKGRARRAAISVTRAKRAMRWAHASRRLRQHMGR